MNMSSALTPASASLASLMSASAAAQSFQATGPEQAGRCWNGEAKCLRISASSGNSGSPFQHRPACSGPVAWKDWAAAEADIKLAKDALAGVKAEDMFMTSPSPGQIARYLKNRYYKSDEEYIYALAD